MKTWVVRLLTLWAFNVIVLLVMGQVVAVGWAAPWAALLLTIATVWLRPAMRRFFQRRAAGSVHKRTKVGEKILQLGIVLLVALIVWIAVVLLSGVNTSGWISWWVFPPIILAIAWMVWDAIAARVEAKGQELYVKALGGPASPEPTRPRRDHP
ncbi:hypothetical protein [Microbacterium xanthum]|uniref:hypothetical protein n=1 Tax=Microbacterium xanthum TaxID=3079794 RepID=UPI002AD417B3|nr:hypothetical protein [Microbacterium sp. KSW-48]MDZ8170954.1 hypothetical protein [Microbacterium sp. KSW-48]